MDLHQREGKYPLPPQAPKTLGVEFSGTIEETVGDSDTFKKGEDVFGLAYGGAYAEYIAVDNRMLIHKPAEISWEEAAGIPETWITALQAMYLVGEFKKGKTILWHAGASSVSLAGIQLSKVEGAGAIYVTASSQEKIDFCKKAGATAGFNYKTQNWSEEILKATDGKGVDVIVDFIGASYFQGNINAAARDGRIVTLANMGGSELPEKVNILGILFKRLRIEGSTLRSRDLEYQAKLRDLLFDHAVPRFKDGTFKVFVEKVFSWEDIIEAHKLMESNSTKGKLICTIP
jgi:NADPH:quinone reductase-like Zn-dependent oxidoreductase